VPQKAGGEHPRIVDDQEVTRPQMGAEIGDLAVNPRARLAIEHKQARRAARNGGLRNQLFRKVIVEIGNQHGTKSAKLGHNCTIFAPRRMQRGRRAG
jgi:hypothetical protein